MIQTFAIVIISPAKNICPKHKPTTKKNSPFLFMLLPLLPPILEAPLQGRVGICWAAGGLDHLDGLEPYL